MERNILLHIQVGHSQKQNANTVCTRKELLAFVTFVKHYKHYFYGQKFLVRTDHSFLKWLMNFKNPGGQIAHWIEVLSSYMTVEHRPGRLNNNADGISKIPCNQCRKSDRDSAHALNAVGPSDPGSLDLKSLQEDDRDISLIRAWLEKGEKPGPAYISSENYVLKTLVCQWKRLEIHDRLVVRNMRFMMQALLIGKQ